MNMDNFSRNLSRPMVAGYETWLWGSNQCCLRSSFTFQGRRWPATFYLIITARGRGSKTSLNQWDRSKSFWGDQGWFCIKIKERWGARPKKILSWKNWHEEFDAGNLIFIFSLLFDHLPGFLKQIWTSCSYLSCNNWRDILHGHHLAAHAYCAKISISLFWQPKKTWFWISACVFKQEAISI